MSNHTPGPWKAHGNEIRDTEFGVIVARCPEWGTHADRPDEREANARLIAATPELLEACKLFTKAVSQAQFDECVRVARAAIAKAEAA